LGGGVQDLSVAEMRAVELIFEPFENPNCTHMMYVLTLLDVV